MGEPKVNLYNLKEPISQELGLWWSRGFQSVLETFSIGWISTSQKTVKIQKKKTISFNKTLKFNETKNKVYKGA